MPTPNVRDIDAQIGRRLRARRIELGLSQQKLAATIGVSYQQIQKYERGTNRMGGSMIVCLAQRLQTEPGYFFEGVRAKAATGPAPLAASLARDVGAEISDRETMELIKAYGAIRDPAQRKGVRQLVNAMAAPTGIRKRHRPRLVRPARRAA
jgi:transcriptional regulator with XRE-family HTH domain